MAPEKTQCFIPRPLCPARATLIQMKYRNWEAVYRNAAVRFCSTGIEVVDITARSGARIRFLYNKMDIFTAAVWPNVVLWRDSATQRTWGLSFRDHRDMQWELERFPFIQVFIEPDRATVYEYRQTLERDNFLVVSLLPGKDSPEVKLEPTPEEQARMDENYLLELQSPYPTPEESPSPSEHGLLPSNSTHPSEVTEDQSTTEFLTPSSSRNSEYSSGNQNAPTLRQKIFTPSHSREALPTLRRNYFAPSNSLSISLSSDLRKDLFGDSLDEPLTPLPEHEEQAPSGPRANVSPPTTTMPSIAAHSSSRKAKNKRPQNGGPPPRGMVTRSKNRDTAKENSTRAAAASRFCPYPPKSDNQLPAPQRVTIHSVSRCYYCYQGGFITPCVRCQKGMCYSHDGISGCLPFELTTLPPDLLCADCYRITREPVAYPLPSRSLGIGRCGISGSPLYCYSIVAPEHPPAMAVRHLHAFIEMRYLGLQKNDVLVRELVLDDLRPVREDEAFLQESLRGMSSFQSRCELYFFSHPHPLKVRARFPSSSLLLTLATHAAEEDGTILFCSKFRSLNMVIETLLPTASIATWGQSVLVLLVCGGLVNKALAQVRWASLLASGGADGLVCIWATSTGELVQEVECESEITCLIWTNDSVLLCAAGQGKVAFIRVNSNSAAPPIICDCISALPGTPIDHLAFYSDRKKSILCAAGRGAASLWKLDDRTGRWFSPPRRIPQHAQDEYVASARFIHQGDTLMLSYAQRQEIVCWKVSPWTQLFRITLPTRILAISPDENEVVVYNLKNGFDVYRYASPISSAPESAGRHLSGILEPRPQSTYLITVSTFQLPAGANSDIAILSTSPSMSYIDIWSEPEPEKDQVALWYYLAPIVLGILFTMFLAPDESEDFLKDVPNIWKLGTEYAIAAFVVLRNLAEKAWDEFYSALPSMQQQNSRRLLDMRRPTPLDASPSLSPIDQETSQEHPEKMQGREKPRHSNAKQSERVLSETEYNLFIENQQLREAVSDIADIKVDVRAGNTRVKALSATSQSQFALVETLKADIIEGRAELRDAIGSSTNRLLKTVAENCASSGMSIERTTSEIQAMLQSGARENGRVVSLASQNLSETQAARAESANDLSIVRAKLDDLGNHLDTRLEYQDELLRVLIARLPPRRQSRLSPPADRASYGDTSWYDECQAYAGKGTPELRDSLEECSNLLGENVGNNLLREILDDDFGLSDPGQTPSLSALSSGRVSPVEPEVEVFNPGSTMPSAPSSSDRQIIRGQNVHLLVDAHGWYKSADDRTETSTEGSKTGDFYEGEEIGRCDEVSLPPSETDSSKIDQAHPEATGVQSSDSVKSARSTKEKENLDDSKHEPANEPVCSDKDDDTEIAGGAEIGAPPGIYEHSRALVLRVSGETPSVDDEYSLGNGEHLRALVPQCANEASKADNSQKRLEREEPAPDLGAGFASCSTAEYVSDSAAESIRGSVARSSEAYLGLMDYLPWRSFASVRIKFEFSFLVSFFPAGAVKTAKEELSVRCTYLGSGTFGIIHAAYGNIIEGYAAGKFHLQLEKSRATGKLVFQGLWEGATNLKFRLVSFSARVPTVQEMFLWSCYAWAAVIHTVYSPSFQLILCIIVWISTNL
ncbi:hypothetical protein BOTBODRAFT_180504 [Botryobasidium botryosum FD-172 SS1]|uniref:Uncharacterized protein n=1 Tax=Botryobasidium botryosum (strain FD-172 SS1) TaxID=930990 RepID=A0A067LWR0_BOTB1|nr:hypothetical protein BOTBODRAFT_180504 [Botryobasidium botryosum FD-172 SS1]